MRYFIIITHLHADVPGEGGGLVAGEAGHLVPHVGQQPGGRGPGGAEACSRAATQPVANLNNIMNNTVSYRIVQ